MIELKQVTKEYGRATVLKNITLTLDVYKRQELTQRMGGSIGAALYGGTLTVWVEFPRQELDRK